MIPETIERIARTILIILVSSIIIPLKTKASLRSIRMNSGNIASVAPAVTTQSSLKLAFPSQRFQTHFEKTMNKSVTTT